MHRILLIVFFSFIVALGGAGEVLTQPEPSIVGSPPADLSAQSVALQTQDKAKISGWLIRGTPSTGAVLLVHGIRSNRKQMLSRARLLNEQGYSALLIDLPSHGESTGERMTFGIHEADAVKSALDYLGREFPDEKLGVIGISLGAGFDSACACWH